MWCFRRAPTTTSSRIRRVRCPFCSSSSTRVVDSRLTEPGDAVRRRRECEECSGRFTTYERVEGPAVTVLKRDGRRERFDRQKLLRGLERAANKRPVSEEQLEALADSIAAAVGNFADLEELEAGVRRLRRAGVPSGPDRIIGRSQTGQATSTDRRTA